MDMVTEGCDDCVNAYIQTLPKEADYAQDGSLYPEDKKKITFEHKPYTAVQDNTYVAPKVISPLEQKKKQQFISREQPVLDEGIKDGGALQEVEVIGKKRYDYQGCVSGLCNALAEKNNVGVANFRQLNNLYGNAWEINKNSFGQDVDFTDFKNLKEGDIINLSRDEFKTDKEKGIPGSNQHVGYISKIKEGVPYVRHYISNVGVKSDGKTPYGEYFEEPINNIKEKFKYKPTGARRIDYFKDIDSQPSNFKYDSGYKPNQIEQDFASIHIDKKQIQDKLKLTNSEYDELAKIAYGIMGNESSFGRSSKTLYRMAIPDFMQKAVKVGLDVKRGVNVYDDNINNLSQGYSSTKESSLHNIAANDVSTDFRTLNKRIKEGDYDGIERTGNYLRTAFEELGLNPDNLENGANSGKAIMATLAV